MALIPFDGELDAPVSGLTPFTGKLDGEDDGIVSSVKKGLGDVGLKLNVGTTVDIPEQVVGINDLARKTTPLGLLTEAITPDFIKNGRTAAETIGREGLNERRKSLSAEMSPEQQAADQKHYFSDDASWANLTKDGLTAAPGKVADLIGEGKMFGDAWADWRKVTGSAAESLPGTLLTMGPTVKVASSAAKAAAESTLAKTGSAELAQAAATKAAERTAMAAGGMAEGLQGAGAANESTRRSVMEMPIEKLRESPFFQNAMAANGGDEAAARTKAADAAATTSAGGAFLFDAAFGALGDRYLGTAAAGKGTRSGAVARGAAQETPTEFIQSGGEKFSENLGIQQFADPSQKLMQDVGEEATAGALTGGFTGMAMGGAMHRNSTPSLTAPAPQLPDTGPLSRSANIALATPSSLLPGGSLLSQPAEEAAPEKPAEQAVNLSGPDRVDAIGAEEVRVQSRLGELNDPNSGYGPAFDAERLDLQERSKALAVERDTITAAWPAATAGAKTSFSTESGNRITATYALMSAADLNTSHDEKLKPNPTYPTELQPRDRDRAASEMQVSGIAQRLDPARLGESADAATGAPIVGADGLVESGNARTIALKRVYQDNAKKADEYKQFLRDNAARFGLTPQAIDGVQNPVLVRVRETPVDRAEFARQANASTVAQMSSSETAKSDAVRLDSMDDLRPDDNGDFLGSRDFIRRFVSRLPGTEQAGMVDSGGQLSQAGYTRIRNAILAKAYGDSPVLTRMVESLDDNLRNVGKALMAAAPAVAKLRQDVQDGALFDADITPDLMAAVEELSRIKEAGRSVSDALAQAGMFEDGISTEGKDLLRFLDKNIRKPRKIAEFIQRYTEALRAAGNPNQGSLLGDQQAPAKQDIINAAKEQGNATAEQAGQSQGDQGTGQQTGQEPVGAQRDGSSPQSDAAANDPIKAEEWRMFGPETGTLGIPRAEMPQVAVRLRPAMLAFLESHGINHIREDVAADQLKPTQAEYSTVKAARAGALAEDRTDASAVLLSSDGYVLDGHHRWIAKAQQHQPINVIRFDAPIDRLIDQVREFSGVTVSNGSPELLAKRTQAVESFYDAAGDLAQILSKHTRAAMVPEKTPDLMPTLIKLFDSAFDVVGTDIKRATAWVKGRLKAMPELKKVWNKILPETYSKAALQAIEQYDPNKQPANGQMGLFGEPAASKPVQADLFMSSPKKKVEADPYPADYSKSDLASKPDNFKPPKPAEFMPDDLLKRADEYVAKYFTAPPEVSIDPETRAKGEALLAPLVKLAEEAKDDYDARIVKIAKSTGALGQLLAPVKGMKRAVEKMYTDADNESREMDPADVKDLLRSTIVVRSQDDVSAAIAAVKAGFDVVRIKDRFTSPMNTGYRDVLINVKMPNGILAEIQINIPEMLSAKENHGHKLFEVSRVQKDGSDLKKAVDAAMLEYYAAAFSAAKSRQPAAQAKNASSESGAQPAAGNALTGFNVAPSSLSLNTPPSGKTTNSSPLNDAQKAQPAGKASGKFISTTSKPSIAEGKNEAYTDDNGNTDGVANEQRSDTGARSAQGQESGAVPGTADAGQSERVSGRADGRNSGRNPQSGTGNRAGAGLQQTATDRSDEGSRRDENGGRPGARGSSGRNAGIPAGRDIPAKTGRNYAFGDADLTYEGSWLVKARQNVEALELLKQLEKDGRQATKEEQAKLAKFIGWGSSDLANSIFGDKLDKQLQAIGNYEEAVAWMDEYKRDAMQRSQGRHYAAFQALSAKTPGISFYDPQFATITRAQLEAAKPDMAAKKWADLRDRAKAAMTPDEWKEASRSTQYAHYTSKPIVKAMWDAMERMGFKGGSILEPGAGIGVFPGLMSPTMANSSIYTGIEFDSITGGILKQLFPDERILVESFIDSKLPKNFYDVAAGNPPFNNTAILADPAYKKFAFALHDYFFAKSIDSVKPGGLVMFVTSRYTMDKLNDKARAYLAERADLVGAIRLPQTAFKKNAGTDVVTDVLFLRKKLDGETFEHAQPWAKSVPMKVGKKSFPVNEYFHAHPEMVLGTPSDKGKMANSPEPQYTVEAKEGNIDDLFAKAAATLPANIYQAERGSSAEVAAVREIDFNPKAQKEGNFYVTDDGKLMQREGGVGVLADEAHQKNAAVIKDFVTLRDALKQAHYDQLNDGDWETSLAGLKKAYAAFVKKHGQINQFTEMKRVVKATNPDTGETFDDERSYKRFPLLNKIDADPDYTVVMALESINEETSAITESAFLTDRVLGKPQAQEIKTPADALLSVLNDVGHVDIEAIADRLGMDRVETIDALGAMIYEDPAAGWVMADEYLSGNVKKKLLAAQEAAKSDRRYERNIEALMSVQPMPVPPADITVSIGMNWIPAEAYENFLVEKTGIKAKVIYNERTGQWAVDAQSPTSTLAATQEWGTPRRSADDILLAALTGAPIRITETVKESGGGSKTVFMADATEAANQKLAQMRDAFREWMWQDAGRTDKLVALYNDTFNTIVPRSFDGRHLTLPGTSKKWSVFDHVKRGAWRIIQSGNTYLSHAVGSGKTFEMIISAMEQKRLGLIKKPMMVVPNHMLQQFAREWIDLYPAARLMVADEKNFHTENRRKFISRVALSDLDGVIITHSAFKLLDLDPAFKQKMIEQELDYLRAAFAEAGGEEGKKSRDPKIKQIESKIEKMEQKLEAAMSGAGKDKNVRFDEMGVDQIYVDEAHEFRKLGFTTQRQVKGIDSSGSDRAFDLWMKTRWLEEKKPGRSLVMASGTPVTNTLAELYSVQRFMAPAVLEERGLDEFDAWAAMFGQEHTEIEADASGKYAPVTRFSKFVNVPELTQMFREFADVLTSDHLAAMLGDKRPKVQDGSRKIVITPQTGDYRAFKQELANRLAESRAWKPSKDQPNNPDPVIRIIGDGRLAAIDMRFIDPSLPSDPDSKLNRMADEVIRVFKETADFEYKDKAGKVEPNKGATQIVFSDLGFGAGVAESRGFNARAWFEKRLRDAGVPPSQVAFMSDHKKSTAKLKLFKDINAGRVRIVVGSSKNMGTGVNAQQRLIALHHLDTPWYPADLEQREGRIVRQGNKNPLVQLYAYSTKGSYDAVMWQMLASKQRFIDQALSGDSSVRSIDDLSESSQFQIATAMTSDDERAIQLAGLRAEIEKLQRLYRAHEEQRMRMRQDYDIAGETIRLNERKLPGAQKSADLVADLAGDNFKASADGRTFEVRKEFGEALMARFKSFSDQLGEAPVKIGEISSFNIMAMGRTGQGDGYRAGVFIDLPEPVMLTESAAADPVGVALRATGALAGLSRQPAQMQQRIEEAKAKRNALEARITAPFPMAEMLADKIKEAQDLETAMLADQGKLTGIEREMQLEDLWQQKTGAITPMFSRGNGSGMAIRDLSAVVDRVSKRLKNLPRVHVFESPAGLSTKDPAQKALRDFIRKVGAWNDVEGATHEGEIYLFASGMADEVRAEHVLAVHEVTHYGLRGSVGKDLDAALQKVWMLNIKVRKAASILKERNGLKSNIEATEEVLADMVPGDLIKLQGWRRVVKSIRDWLSGVGFDRLAAQFDALMKSGMSDQEQADLMVADLVTAARDWVKNGKGRPYMDGTRLADGSLAEDLAEQEKWLTTEAKARGFKSIDEMAEKNYPAFEKLAAKWRERNPVEGALLSRATGAQTPNQATAAQRAEDILSKPVAAWRPLDTIIRTLTTTARLDRLTSAVYDRAAQLIDRHTPENIKAGVVADYGVPEAVIDQRVMMQGRMKVQLRKAGEMIDKLATLTRAESRVAYEWMNNADPQAQAYFEAQLPAESLPVMEEIKTMIDKLSQEAVALGQLDPESFKRNRFEYLRRSYIKHTAELTKGETASRKRAIAILGEQYKGRGMTDAVDMGKFKNVAPEWWGRKLQDGKADKGLKGEKFIRLERRAPVGEGVMALDQAQGPGEPNPQRKGRLLEVNYWPAGEALPAKYSTWEQSGIWEVRDTKGGKLIVWRDFTKQERVAMGEIDEARYAIAKSLHGMVHDVETGRYLEWLAQRYAKKSGEAIDGEIVDASERMRDVFKPGEWVQVPETKIPGTQVMKYGKLAGRYLPGPVWNDVRQSVGFRFKPLGETYAAILSAWKTAKTALSPAVHTNNVMANFVMADWHDVSAGHILKALRILLATSERDGKGAIGRAGNVAARAGIADRDAAKLILDRYQDSGGNLGTWATAELQKEQLEPLLKALENEIGTVGESTGAQVGVMVALQKAMQLQLPSAWDAFKASKPGQAVVTEARGLIGLYEAEDQVFRLAAWLKAKEDGAGDLAAGKVARKSFLDYNINAPWIQAMRSTALPFIAFTYRAVPMMLETIGKKPHKLMKLALLAGAVNALGYMLAGGDEDDERALLPEEKAGRIWGLVPKLIRMPWNDANGDPVFLDIRRFVPVGDVFDTGATHAAVPLLPFAVPGGPLALLSELMANKSQFTGKSITNETDTPAEKAAKVSDHLYKAFAPNIILLPGTYAWTGVSNAASGRTDSFGREQSTAQAVSSAFGMKVGSYPKDVLQLNAQREVQAKTMEIDRNITQLKRERQRNGIDDKEFADRLDAQVAKKVGILDEFRKKMGGN